MTPAKRSRLLLLIGFAFHFVGGSSALADFNLGAASNYSVLGVGTTTSSLTGTTINGNIGVGSGGTLTATSSSINGNIDFQSSVQFTQTGSKVTGKILGSVAQVGTADTAAQNLSTFAAGEAATITSITNLNLVAQNRTISASPGKDGNTVVNLSGLSITGGTLTLKGGANDYFIFNVAGAVNLTGGNIVLNGVSADHVLFNVEGTGSAVALTTGNYSGIFLAEQREIDVVSSTILGRVLGASNHALAITSAEVDGPVQGVAAAPEPKSFMLCAMGGIALLGAAVWGRRRLPRNVATA